MNIMYTWPRNLMVAWDSFPPQLTITLAGHIEDDEYMAFGLSGEQVLKCCPMIIHIDIATPRVNL